MMGIDTLLLLTPQVTVTPLMVQAKLELMATGEGTSTASVPVGLPLGSVSCKVRELFWLFMLDDMLRDLAVNSAVAFMVSVSRPVEDSTSQPL